MDAPAHASAETGSQLPAGQEIPDEIRDDTSFAFWSDEDLRITAEVQKQVGAQEELEKQEEEASGLRRTWKQTSRLAAATGVVAYEIGSTTLPAVPEWAWGPIAAAMALPEFVRAFRGWWHGKD
ncbi:hypothetical protein LWF15_28005 [Kineosporia rhizophila]|uniref:hypothetical protein n=1 Tax=Kineosporia rhizophila TaxID=84633 RepID=UPI001E6025EB|nr:hypothetical protein [Kineosporia rhizophila]MCE0539348.1 hypothetical protein [Kineosporia rhizophila]